MAARKGFRSLQDKSGTIQIKNRNEENSRNEKKWIKIIDPYAYFERVENLLKNDKTKQCRAGSGFFDINTDGRIMLCVMSDPVDVHYSELDTSNFVETLRPYRDEQLKYCCDRCMLAAYFDTSYYPRHLMETLKVIETAY